MYCKIKQREENRYRHYCSHSCAFRYIQPQVKFKMEWTVQHDVKLCWEVLFINPFQTKPGSKERGTVLQKIATKLNHIEDIRYKVDARAIRDRLNKLLLRFTAKQKEEEKATGIEADYTEIDQLLQEIHELKVEAEMELQQDDENKKKKLKAEEASADSIRGRSMERMSETRKREKSPEDSPTPRKTRNNGNNTVNFLRERNERDNHFKTEELELRKKELEMREKQDEANRPQTEFLIQQGQQQNQALMMLIARLADKI